MPNLRGSGLWYLQWLRFCIALPPFFLWLLTAHLIFLYCSFRRVGFVTRSHQAPTMSPTRSSWPSSSLMTHLAFSPLALMTRRWIHHSFPTIGGSFYTSSAACRERDRTSLPFTENAVFINLLPEKKGTIVRCFVERTRPVMVSLTNFFNCNQRAVPTICYKMMANYA